MSSILKDTSFTPLRDSLPKLKNTVSPRSGIVSSIHELLPSVDDARSFYVAAEMTNTKPLIGSDPDINCGGGAYTREKATAAAIGETLERYSALFIPADELIIDNVNNLGSAAINSEELILFHEEQFKDPNFQYKPFEDNSVISWVQGYSLTTNESKYLPAEMIYLSTLEDWKDNPIGYSTSNGLACGPTFEEAILSGLLEVIERDAIMIAWYNRLSLPIFDLESNTILKKEIEEHLKPTGLSHQVVDLSAISGIPTAIATVRNIKTNSAIFSVGGASDVNPREVVSEALLEAYQTRSWARMLQMEKNKAISKDEIKSFDDHITYYLDERNLHPTDFLVDSNKMSKINDQDQIPGNSPKEKIKHIVSILEEQGINVYIKDVTSVDVRQAGFSVVKVMCPQMVQLNAGHNNPFLGANRIYTLPKKLGFKENITKYSELNPYPHPFP